ncbi:MAG: DNA-binding protein [Clostridia bacterium]|nr:DNA-binding protein [Clostridia bacterium]
MEYRRKKKTIVVRLDRGEEIISALTEVCQREKITFAAISGIGAADQATVGLYNVEEQVYRKTELTGPMEICALTGNASRKDGEVYLHLHITLCDEEMRCRGGHLNACRIAATAEIVLQVSSLKVERRLDPAVGLNVFLFDEED